MSFAEAQGGKPRATVKLTNGTGPMGTDRGAK